MNRYLKIHIEKFTRTIRMHLTRLPLAIRNLSVVFLLIISSSCYSQKANVSMISEEESTVIYQDLFTNGILTEEGIGELRRFVEMGPQIVEEESRELVRRDSLFGPEQLTNYDILGVLAQLFRKEILLRSQVDHHYWMRTNENIAAGRRRTRLADGTNIAQDYVKWFPTSDWAKMEKAIPAEKYYQDLTADNYKMKCINRYLYGFFVPLPKDHFIGKSFSVNGKTMLKLLDALRKTGLISSLSYQTAKGEIENGLLYREVCVLAFLVRELVPLEFSEKSTH